MSIPNGDFIIASSNNPLITATSIGRLPDVAIRGTVGPPTIWRITHVDDSNLITISLPGPEGYNLIVRDHLLFLSTNAPTQFSIVPTGAPRVRIQLPNDDSVWRLDAAEGPVVVMSSDGSPGEIWTIRVVVPDA